ncbi:MAG: ABC transporter ATP-binding protein [Gallionella sp.]|nr:ABC transporter ATP-binding protein [Gallionella sp.]
MSREGALSADARTLFDTSLHIRLYFTLFFIIHSGALILANSEVTLSARNLTRRFGNQEVIHDLSLELRRGEVLGLLGHNGAGKSTTLKMLTGCLPPSGGGITVCGVDLLKNSCQAKQHIGYLPETPPLYRELSVHDFLTFAAKLRGMAAKEVPAAVTETQQRCGLESVSRKLIATLSKGYQQRVGIAQAIIHRPAVIVLDEPTVGLDPAQIRDIRALIRELGNSSSVILSTHLLSEVENVCDRVEIMQRGKLIYSDSSAGMKHYKDVSGFTLTLRNPPPLAELASIAGVQHVEAISATQFRILHTAETNPSSALLTLATQNNWQLEQLTPLHTSLEEVFMKITDAESALTGVAR